jgi:hypothetical protein
MDEREARADRWAGAAHAGIGTVEPEWWLRLVCGQLAEEPAVADHTGVRGVVRRAEKQLKVRFGRMS